MADHLALQLFVPARLGSLALERIHLPSDLFEDVEDAREVLFGAFEFRLGQPAPCLELRDAGGLLDDRTAVLRFRTEELPDAALLDDCLGLRPQARPHENVLDVAEAGLSSVNQVFAVAGPEQAAGNGDLLRLS